MNIELMMTGVLLNIFGTGGVVVGRDLDAPVIPEVGLSAGFAGLALMFVGVFA